MPWVDSLLLSGFPPPKRTYPNSAMHVTNGDSTAARLVWRSTFRREDSSASLVGLLATVTALRPDWIELLFGVDPDHSDGTFEWVIVGVLLCRTVALTSLARREWRRARPVRA